MAGWSKWIGVGAALGIMSALVPVVQGRVTLDESLSKLTPGGAVPAVDAKPAGPDLSGLDLTRLRMRPRRVTTPLQGGRTAELTLDPQVQRAAVAQMKRYRVPEAGVVVIDVKTGRLLAYASHVASGEVFDVNVRAEAPAASVFKVITGATLVEHGGLDHTTEQCYRGGRSGVSEHELDDDPARDKWCATLAIAMGRSLNVVFARLALKNITPEELTAMGGAFGFGSPVPFVVENEAPKIDIPHERLEFARTSAGFWNTSLSPLAGALVAQTVANGGVTLEPRILKSIHKGKETVWTASDEPRVIRRAIKEETADELTQMMVETVANGSAYKQFHDRRRRPFLPDIEVAGKTGTLTRHKLNRHYTWFVGFAPADKPEIAISTLVVNTPRWRIRAPQLACNVMRSYFAKKGRKGVSSP